MAGKRSGVLIALAVAAGGFFLLRSSSASAYGGTRLPNGATMLPDGSVVTPYGQRLAMSPQQAAQYAALAAGQQGYTARDTLRLVATALPALPGLTKTIGDVLSKGTAAETTQLASTLATAPTQLSASTWQLNTNYAVGPDAELPPISETVPASWNLVATDPGFWAGIGVPDPGADLALDSGIPDDMQVVGWDPSGEPILSHDIPWSDVYVPTPDVIDALYS